MTTFQRITKLRKRTITVDSETADRLEKFTQFVRETQGDDLTQSDIMGTILMEGLQDKRIRFPKPRSEATLELKLPETAWHGLEKLSKSFGVDEKEIIKKLLMIRTKSQNFSKWKGAMPR